MYTPKPKQKPNDVRVCLCVRPKCEDPNRMLIRNARKQCADCHSRTIKRKASTLSQHHLASSLYSCRLPQLAAVPVAAVATLSVHPTASPRPHR